MIRQAGGGPPGAGHAEPVNRRFGSHLLLLCNTILSKWNLDI
jgi:hypothetical protein